MLPFDIELANAEREDYEFFAGSKIKEYSLRDSAKHNYLKWLDQTATSYERGTSLIHDCWVHPASKVDGHSALAGRIRYVFGYGRNLGIFFVSAAC